MSLSIARILSITGVVLTATIVLAANNSLADQVESGSQGILGQLDQFHRGATLPDGSDKSGNEDNIEQIKAATYLITLRATHCKTLANVLYEGDVEEELDDENKFGFETDIPDELAAATEINHKSISRLECRGASNIEDEFSSIVIEKTPGASTISGVLRGTELEEDAYNDQEGNAGNLKLTYPSDAKPLVIDGKEHINSNVPGLNPDNGNGQLWDNTKLYFTPDPEIAKFAEWNLFDGDVHSLERYNSKKPPYNNGCWDYPIRPSLIAMKDVPMINSSPLYFEERPEYYSSTVSDKSRLSNGRVPLIDVGHAETSSNKGGGTGHVCRYGPIFSMKQPSRYLKGHPKYSEDFEGHRDYQFVICPGSVMKIQANAGNPYNEGEAEESTSFYKGENTVFPFVQLLKVKGQEDSTNRGYCLQKYEMSNSEGWTPISESRVTKSFSLVFQYPEGDFENNVCGPGRVEFKGSEDRSIFLEFWKDSKCTLDIKVNQESSTETLDRISFEKGEDITFSVHNSGSGQQVVLESNEGIPNEDGKFTHTSNIHGFELEDIEVESTIPSGSYPDPPILRMDLKDISKTIEIESSHDTTSFLDNFEVLSGSELSPNEDGEYRFVAEREGHKARWAPESDSNPVEQKISNYKCEEYGHLNKGFETFEFSGKTFEIGCGLKRMFAFERSYWSFQKFIREKGASSEN